MKYTVEQTFNNLNRTCLGWGYQRFTDELVRLLWRMRDKIGHPFTGKEYHNLKFFMNIPLYNVFSISCKLSGHDPDMFNDVRIVLDPTMYVGDTQSPDGYVRLIYEEPEIKTNSDLYGYSIQQVFYDEFIGLDRGHGFKKVPHIDHVKFNGPATVVFWKDGTKTVVKHDGKGRKDNRLAILYAFIRKIYGEGKPYHNILNEIEEAIK